jgi:16S rRNA (adenine1518-N6/adenine1519-N6)-dimethyltransferase
VNHQAKKKFGQNFLKDKNLLDKITREANINDKTVIEVGPGQGSLTSFLASKAKYVFAYEIDESLKPILDQIEKAHHNLKIFYQDFMETDLSIYKDEIHVVANVPYYITTPILFKILESNNVKSATLMIQKEVIERLLAKPNTKAYNALSIMIQYLTEAHKVMDVKRHMFQPVPNVDSAVITLVKKTHHDIEVDLQERFLKLVKEAFKQKRKTLVNNWHQSFGISKQTLEGYLESLGFNKQVRAESLTESDFMTLAKGWLYDC